MNASLAASNRTEVGSENDLASHDLPCISLAPQCVLNLLSQRPRAKGIVDGVARPLDLSLWKLRSHNLWDIIQYLRPRPISNDTLAPSEHSTT
jgi:hypothetical protein